MAYAPSSNLLSKLPKVTALSNLANSASSTYPLQRIGGSSTAPTNSGGFFNDIKNTIGGAANNIRQGGSATGYGVTSSTNLTPTKTSVNPVVSPVKPPSSTTSGTMNGTVVPPKTTTTQSTSSTQSTPVPTPSYTTPTNYTPTQTNPNQNSPFGSGAGSYTPFSSMVSSLANQSGSQFNQSTQNAINGLQGIANTPNQGAVTAQQGLQNIATNQTPQVINAQKDYNDFAQSSPYMLAAQHNPNVAADVASGRSALLGQTFGAILGAKGQAVTNALGAQGQQINAGQGAGNMALDAQGQQINAGSSAGSLAQSGQSTAQSGLSSALSASQPHFNGYVGIDPQTGQAIGGGSINNAIQTGVNANTYEKQSSDYQTGLKNLRAADGLQSGIVQTLQSNPQLNQTPISAITNLKQWLAGQTSDPAQQVLAQQVANYVQALGYTPEQAATIALQKGGTIGTLLDALRSTYEAQNNANLGSSQNTTQSSGKGGQFDW